MTRCRRYISAVDVSRYKYLLILDNTSDEQQNNTKWMFRMYLVWGPWIKGNNTSSRKERAFRLQTIFAGFKNTSNYLSKKSSWEKNIIENHHFPAHTLTKQRIQFNCINKRHLSQCRLTSFCIFLELQVYLNGMEIDVFVFGHHHSLFCRIRRIHRV